MGSLVKFLQRSLAPVRGVRAHACARQVFPGRENLTGSYPTFCPRGRNLTRACVRAHPHPRARNPGS